MAEVTCPETGAQLARGVRQLQLTYKGESVVIDMPGWYGVEGTESVHSAKDMAVSDRALNGLKARLAGLLGPGDIRRIRRQLRLTQEEAGRLIGGGPRGFQKYEAGDLLPSRAVSSALRLLEHDPAGLQVLRQTETRDAVAAQPA